MTIDEAIKHCLEVAEQNEFETRIYDELNRQGDNAALREFNDKIYDILAKQFGSPCNLNYAVDEYMRRNGGCDDCGIEIPDKECWSRYIQTKLIGDKK